MNDNERDYFEKLIKVSNMHVDNSELCKLLCRKPLKTVVDCSIHVFEHNCSECDVTGKCAIELIGEMPKYLQPGEIINVIDKFSDSIALFESTSIN